MIFYNYFDIKLLIVMFDITKVHTFLTSRLKLKT